MDPNKRPGRIVSGIVWANVTALGLILATSLLAYMQRPPNVWMDPAITWIASSFVVIPILMGFIATRIWREAGLSRGETWGYSTVNLLVSITLSTIVLREGVICLIMALPLLTIFLAIGNLIGRAVNDRHSRMQVTITPMLLCIAWFDTLTTKGYKTSVSDTVIIQAPPSIVWHYIIDYPAITKPSEYWLCKLGLPAPVESTSTTHAIGATRQCIFTGNMTIDERIIEMEPEKRLSFLVIKQPNHPEIVGHILLHKGQFTLKDNKDGTTTLIGTSWYTLNVHPAEYYDLWAKDVIRNVHARVFNQIKALAEKEKMHTARLARANE